MDGIGGSNGRMVQKRAVRRDGWTMAKRRRFLDELAASCNVRRSAAAVGLHDSTVRALRRRDPAFAAAWEAALEDGYTRIETELLERAIAADDATGWGPYALAEGEAVAVPPPMDDAMKLRVLQLRDARGKRLERAERLAVASEAEVELALFRQLEKVSRHRGKRA